MSTYNQKGWIEPDIDEISQFLEEREQIEPDNQAQNHSKNNQAGKEEDRGFKEILISNIRPKPHNLAIVGFSQT